MLTTRPEGVRVSVLSRGAPRETILAPPDGAVVTTVAAGAGGRFYTAARDALNVELWELRLGGTARLLWNTGLDLGRIAVSPDSSELAIEVRTIDADAWLLEPP
jgi:hypothetical protein